MRITLAKTCHRGTETQSQELILCASESLWPVVCECHSIQSSAHVSSLPSRDPFGLVGRAGRGRNGRRGLQPLHEGEPLETDRVFLEQVEQQRRRLPIEGHEMVVGVI